MKKTIWMLCFVTLAMSSSVVWASSSDKIYLRPLFGMGYTLISNSKSATYGDIISDDISRTAMNGGFGVHVLSDISSRLRLGVEASFTHYINETTDNGNHPLSTTGDEYCYHTVNTVALAEFKISDSISLLAGSGLATAVKPFNRFTGATPYFMIAPTWNIKISKETSIPLMLRVSTLDSGKGDFGDGDGFGSIFGLTLMSGVTLQY